MFAVKFITDKDTFGVLMKVIEPYANEIKILVPKNQNDFYYLASTANWDQSYSPITNALQDAKIAFLNCDERDCAFIDLPLNSKMGIDYSVLENRDIRLR